MQEEKQAVSVLDNDAAALILQTNMEAIQGSHVLYPHHDAVALISQPVEVIQESLPWFLPASTVC